MGDRVALVFKTLEAGSSVEVEKERTWLLMQKLHCVLGFEVLSLFGRQEQMWLVDD
jgi:hypothetical protein